MRNDNTWAIIAVIILVLFLAGSLGFSMMGFGNYGAGGMMNWIGSSFGFMWMFGWIFMLLLIITLVLFIVWLVIQLQQPKQQVRRKR